MKYRVIGSIIVLVVILVCIVLRGVLSPSSPDDGGTGTDTPPAASQ